MSQIIIEFCFDDNIFLPRIIHNIQFTLVLYV